jgi:aspartate/methionine/tyrosine aminotransferase
MDLPPFLLDHWLARYEFATPPIRYNLASSTGPKWALKELLAIGDEVLSLDDLKIGYAPPEGSAELRAALGAFLGVDPDWVVVTTGASEAVSILFCLAAKPLGNVLMPRPAFGAFPAMARAWGMGTRHYTLSRECGFRASPDAVVAATNPQTAIVLVNTPHNPSGSVAPREEIEAIAGGLAERGIPLIVDEVYHPLYFGAPQKTAAPIANVNVMGDMSKAMSLAGLRIGWLIEHDSERRKKIVDARGYFTISSSPLLEKLAAHALINSGAVLDRLSDVATANLDALARTMERVSDVLGWVRPEGGTVCFPWFRDGRNSRPFCERLAAAGVLVAPGDCFKMPDHMRVGFGAQAEGFSDALAVFEKTLRAL